MHHAHSTVALKRRGRRIGKPDPRDDADLFEPEEYGEGWELHPYRAPGEAGSAIPR